MTKENMSKKENFESLVEKEIRLEKMISDFNLLKEEYDKKEAFVDTEIERLEEELRILEQEKLIKTQVTPETVTPETVNIKETKIDLIKNEIEVILENKEGLKNETVLTPENTIVEIITKPKKEKISILSKVGKKIGGVFSYLIDKLRNDKKEILIPNGPNAIKIKEVISENVSEEEIKEIQKEILGQDIEQSIKNEVVEQINNKEISTVKAKKIESKLKRASRKVRNYLLMVLVSATTFESTTFSTSSSRDQVLSYNNIKVDDLSDWEKVKLYEDEMNTLDNISLITQFNENSDDKYIIIDKQNGKAHQYQGDNLIKSYNVCVGDSIGDDQTKLKSIYRKKFDDSDRVFHRNPPVSLDEATYVENGERYLRDGYEALTDWGAGNMQTGAGIYMVSNKGPFMDDVGIFLKNERGIQVATSLHVNKHLKERAPDFRFTNGCVGFSKENLYELYKDTKEGEKIYILPDNTHNRFKIVDGELRFLSDQQNVNRTIRPYEPKPVVLQAENANEDSKIWLMTITENKAKLMSLYPTIPNGVYNELAKISYGILGTESTFGTYGGPRGQVGRAVDITKSIVGFSTNVGPGQVGIEHLEPKVKEVFGIKSTHELFDVKFNAIATMSILLDNYLYAVNNGKEKDYKKLTILRYNASVEASRIAKGKKTIEELGPKTRGYIKRVLNFSDPVKIYTESPGDNFYNPNWDYGNPNDLAMNNN